VEPFDEILKKCDYNRCKVCTHFKRVNAATYDNVTNRRGFCILGGLDGDYSLYISTSSAKDCMGFIFDENHYKITLAERNLSEEMDTFSKSLDDKRTANYKLIEPLLKSTEEFMKTTKHPIAWMAAINQVRIIGNQYFRENHQEDFAKVYNMVTLKQADYNKFLAKISVEIHNRFCDCDKIEYNGDK
jgi:hypothetical protein